VDKLKKEETLSLRGKNAIITGSSRGLGLAIARELALVGCNVLLVARGEEDLKIAKEQLEQESSSKISSIQADITNKAGIEQIIQAGNTSFDEVDILVVNTGGPPNGPSIHHSNEAWWQAFDTILLPSVRLSRHFAPKMREGGVIIFLIGVGAKQPIPHSVLSNSMHAAVMVLSKILSKEVGGFGIRVNCVLAGPFNTGRLHRLTKSWASEHGLSYEIALNERYTSKIDISHRLGDASELAAVLTFLCSKRASFITGASITVDGGFIDTLY
jgi:3-oxoacyl-[acyl-carrier protein] reductase